jgi:outer membrane protein assembly factor BamE (lipoprotein component of BamABCDE complex)
MVGCATVGKNFNYQKKAELRLGATTQEEAVQLIGKPLKSSSITKGDGRFEVLQYTYASANLGGAQARVLFLEFKNGILNAHIFNSGFPEDSTAFNMDAAEQVKRGSSTKTDVAQIMGEPSGKAFCPTTLNDFKDMASNSTEIWSWIYTSKSKGLDTSTIKSRIVKISFDDAGIVSDIQTTEEH